MPALPPRFAELAREVSKFGVVGAVAFVVDLGLYNVIRFGLDLQPLRSSILATLVAMTVAYVGNRYWTWSDRHRHGVRRQYVMFAVVNGAGLAIQVACLALTVYAFGLDGGVTENVAKIVGIGLGTLFRFWAYRTWVFPRLPAPTDVDPALEETTVTPY